MPPRRIKAIPVENTLTDDDEIETADEDVTYNDIVNKLNEEEHPATEEVDDVVLEIHNEPSKPVKVKKTRIVKKEEDPITVSSCEEDPEPEPEPEPIINEVEKNDNIKVVELLQCEKCGKKLTARTLKYSHNAVCPANEAKTPPKKKRVKEDELQEDITEEQPQPLSTRIAKIRNRQEKIMYYFLQQF